MTIEELKAKLDELPPTAYVDLKANGHHPPTGMMVTGRLAIQAVAYHHGEVVITAEGAFHIEAEPSHVDSNRNSNGRPSLHPQSPRRPHGD